MKRVLVAVLAILILLFLGGMWFWSLAKIPAEMDEGVTLHIEQGPVEVMHVKTQNWVTAIEGERLTGSDRVRTGSGGRAVIRFYHGGESRLQAQSEIVIDQASKGEAGTLNVRLSLLSGRVWSRLLRLFDLDGSFSVKTSSVIATVRGTAFDLGMNASGTTMWVSDAAVDLSPAESSVPLLATQEPLAIPEGLRLTRTPNGVWEQPHPLSEEDVSSEWFLRNRASDVQFLERVNTDLSKRYDVPRAQSSSGFNATLLNWSEQAHLAFASSAESPRLRGTYMAWRLYAVKRLIEQGNTGLASQELTSIEQELQRVLKRADGKAALPAYRKTVNELTALFHDVGPASPLFRMKLWLEDIQTPLADADDARLIFARLLSADARLDETVMLLLEKKWSDARTSLEAAENGIANGNRDVVRVAANLSSSNADALRAKLRALRARADALRTLLTRASEPLPIVAPTSTPAEPISTPTSTPTVVSTTVTTSTASPTVATTAPWDALVLSAQPNPVAVGSTAALRVVGTRKDGSSGDLTAVAKFQLIGNIGSLNGPIYTATQAGSVTIEATVMDQGTAKTARLVLQIQDAVTLMRVDAIPQGATTVLPGGRLAFGATAIYSNNQSSNVTSKAVWSVSDPKMGSMVGNTFTANTGVQGSVTITGAYTEQGTTVDGAVVVTISPNTALF